MSIASRITEMETHISNAYTSIDNLGIDISNTNKNIYNISTLLDTFYERLPKVSGIGASLSLSPSLMGKIKLNEIQGNTLQDSQPTPDTPVPIQSVTGLQNVEVCDKNLLDTSSFYNGYVNSSGVVTGDTKQALFDYVKVEPSGTYTISSQGTVSNLNIVQYDINKNYISRTVQTNNPKTFTLGNTTYYVRIWTKVSDDTPMTQEIVNGLKLQLEQGSTATTYEPYKGNTYEVNLGNIELNKIGDYQDSIKKSTGKNLCFNITKPSNANLKFFIDKPEKTFTISFTTNETLSNNSLYLEIDGTSYGNIGGITASANTRVEKTYTLSDTDYQAIQNGTNIDLLLYKNNANFNIPSDGMIENNSTASPYEPYGEVWYVEKNTRKLELAIADMNNSEDYPGWRNQTQLKNDYPNKNGNFRDFPTSYVSNIAIQPSSSYDAIAGNTTADGVVFLNRSYFGSTYTQTYWKTNYSNLIFTLIYNLKTPEYEIITNTELIEDLESLYNAKSEDGTTNINVTSEDLSMILNVGVLKGDAE